MIFVILSLIVGCVGTSPSCMDENGNAVDWFYVYKLPKESKNANILIKRGVAYMYITPQTLKTGWVMSKLGIRNMNSMPARTLAPLYENPNILSVIYNDQPPVSKKIVPKSRHNKHETDTTEMPFNPVEGLKRYKRKITQTTPQSTNIPSTINQTTHPPKINVTTPSSRIKRNRTTKTHKSNLPARSNKSSTTFPYKTKATTLSNKMVPNISANKSKATAVAQNESTQNVAPISVNTANYTTVKDTNNTKANRITVRNKSKATPVAQNESIQKVAPLSVNIANHTTVKDNNHAVVKTATASVKTTVTISTEKMESMKPENVIKETTPPYKVNAPTTTYKPTTTTTTMMITTRKPAKKLTTKGFSKGVIIGDSISGVWMTHSVPKFPPRPNGTTSNITYNFPLTSAKFGQLFYCVTVATVTLDEIGRQLKYHEPLVAFHHIPESLKTKLPHLDDVVNNRSVIKAPWYRLHTFETLAGKRFLSFAKSGKLKSDLYSGLVAPKLGSNLFVESWQNGPGVLDSECTDSYQVHNVEQVKFASLNLAFTSMFDQSKWAVTASLLARKVKTNNTIHWLCVGDTNRMAPHETRGGGTVCTSDPTLWEHFAQLVSSIKPCMDTLKYYN